MSIKLSPSIKANIPLVISDPFTTGRRKVIAALAALVRHWKGLPAKDRPKPPFTSFPEWGEVVGGIMIACGLGNLRNRTGRFSECGPYLAG